MTARRAAAPALMIALAIGLVLAGCTRGKSPTEPYCTPVKDQDSAVVGRACWVFP